MKKKIFILLVAAMCILTTSCGTDEINTHNNNGVIQIVPNKYTIIVCNDNQYNKCFDDWLMEKYSYFNIHDNNNYIYIQRVGDENYIAFGDTKTAKLYVRNSDKNTLKTYLQNNLCEYYEIEYSTTSYQ